MAPRLWTIGHSNHPIDDFLEALAAHKIEAIADVRRFPGSRRYPQFNRETLEAGLQKVGVDYHHFPALGGRRTSRLEDSPNAAWRVAAFRAYADYMQTDEFGAAFAELTTLAEAHRTALMCAEVLPWRCHRRLLADRFTVLSWEFLDIMTASQAKKHELPPFAVVTLDNGLTYPAE